MGGADAVDVMADIPWELKCPKVSSHNHNSFHLRKFGLYSGECSGSVVECLIWDRVVASLSLTRGTVLCP